MAPGPQRPEAGERVVREPLLLADRGAETAVHPDDAEEQVRKVQGVVVRMVPRDRLEADRDVRLGLVREVDEPRVRRPGGRRRRRTWRRALWNRGDRSRDGRPDEGRVHITGQAQDEPLPPVAARVELEQPAGLDGRRRFLLPFRVPPVRMARGEHAGQEFLVGALPRRFPISADVREKLPANALDLLRRHDRVREAIRCDPERDSRRRPRRPPPEDEEVLRRVKLEGGPVALQGLRQVARVAILRPAEEETGEELRHALLARPLRGDARGEASVEGDEGACRVRQPQHPPATLHLDALGAERHGPASA